MFKPWSALAAAAIVVAGMSTAADAQMAHRLKGSLTTATGTAIKNGKIRAEAIAGFRGEQFVGQKEHTTASNEMGEWSITGTSPAFSNAFR